MIICFKPEYQSKVLHHELWLNKVFALIYTMKHFFSISSQKSINVCLQAFKVAQ